MNRIHTIEGQPSWGLKSDLVELRVTRLGGQVAPAWFRMGRRRVQPFAVAPWARERLGPKVPAMLKALRGDFFCLPFGGNARAFRGEKHPPHGETANLPWDFLGLEEAGGSATLRLALRTRVRPGKVLKELTLRKGHSAIYSRHLIETPGPWCLGHHPCLKFRGPGILSSSGFSFGQVYPGTFESPRKGGRSFLKPGAIFSRLDKVPASDGSLADLSHYPARRGYEDLVLLATKQALPFAWTGVTFPGSHVFLNLKDTRTLGQAVLWFSNGGRDYTPWDGRHFDVLGLEEVTAYFHEGLAESCRPNALNRKGIKTFIQVRASKPLDVRFIMACLPVPKGFDRLAQVLPRKGRVTLVAANGTRSEASLAWEFLEREG